MWYDNKDCFYSLIRENETKDMMCFYEYVKFGNMSAPPHKCNQDSCPIVHPELVKSMNKNK